MQNQKQNEKPKCTIPMEKISKPLIVLFRLDISCTAVNLEKYN